MVGAPTDVGERRSKHSLKGRTRCARTSQQALKGRGGGTSRRGRKKKQALTERTWWVVGATRCTRTSKQALEGRGRGTTKCARRSKQALKGRGGGHDQMWETEQTSIDMSWWGVGTIRCAQTTKQALKGCGGGGYHQTRKKEQAGIH